MLEQLIRLFAARPLREILRDLLDIAIVAWVIYRALLVLRGTRAIQMAIGLGIVGIVYLGAKVFHFATLLALLSSLLSSIVLIVVVVFQNDIRRALIRMGGTAWFTGGREQQSRVIDEVVAAATELARHRMGALIAFEQDANVLEFVKSEGIPLDSMVTRELLVSLFVPESVNKLHDGAVLIRDLKIARAGVFFPMPDTKVLDAQLGSRHRAALGITEETDAVVVVVSEERGTISFCFSGNIVSNLDGQSLRHALLGLFGRSTRKKRPSKKPPVQAAPIRTPTPAPPTRGSVVHPPASKASPPPAAADKAAPPKPGGKVTTSTPMKPAEGETTGMQKSEIRAPITGDTAALSKTLVTPKSAVSPVIDGGSPGKSGAAPKPPVIDGGSPGKPGAAPKPPAQTTTPRGSSTFVPPATSNPMPGPTKPSVPPPPKPADEASTTPVAGGQPKSPGEES